MKNLKKGLALICAMVLACGMFAGCGNSEDSNVEVFKMWTNSSSEREMEQVAEFNETIGKENGIKIELTNYGADYAKTVEMAIANDQAPDFFKRQGSLQAQVDKGNLLPINELPGMEDLIKDYEHMLSEGEHKIGDKIYSLPGRRIVYGMIYNKDMFKAAGIVDENGEAKYPRTFDEVYEYAKLLTNPDKNEYGFIFPLKWTGFWGTEVTKYFSTYSGKTALDRDADKFDHSYIRPMVEWVLKMKDSGTLFPGSDSMENDAARAQFAAGRIGMKMAASWDVYVLNDQFPAECEWGACPLPKFDINDPDYYQASSIEQLIDVSSSVVKNGRDLEKVALIYKWFYSDERIGELYQYAELIPAKAEIAEKYEVKVNKQGQQDFGDIAVLADRPSGSPWVSLKYEGEQMAAVLDKVWHGQMTLDEAIAQLDRDYNAAYDKAKQENDMEKYYAQPIYDWKIPADVVANSRFLGGK